MKKSIRVMLCICLLTGLVSGCAAEESNLTEDSKPVVFEESCESETIAAAENELIPDDNAEGDIEISDENLKPEALYVANRELWEPEDGSVCCYAWSDIDGNGQPELFIAEHSGGGNGYEIHIFMIEEDGNGIRDVSASDGSGILTDHLPVNEIYRDHGTDNIHRDCGIGALYYLDDSKYFYYRSYFYYGSSMVQRNRFCREEDSVFYDSDGNEITFARWQNLNKAFAQEKILSSEKLVWKELNIQSGHLTNEELLEELKTSYAGYLLSMENRDVDEIIDCLSLSLAQNEEEEILLREFIKMVQKGESAQIVFLRYTAENIPVPIYIDYDGEDFYGIWDESKDPYAESACPYHGFRYEYLKVFSEAGEDGITHETAVLTNEENLSWEDLMGSGDKAENDPDYLILYGDMETKDALCFATDAVRIEKGNIIKRNGVYLIEDGAQLELISKMVVKGEEIEEGVAAATGIYRLCSDVEVRDHLRLGSQRVPFLGCLYVDRHIIMGSFSLSRESMEDWNYFDFECVQETPVSIAITIEDEETLEKAEQTLMQYPAECLAIYVSTEKLDMQTAAELVKQCWEANHERNHYSISMTDVTEQREKSGALQPFLDLFGEEGGALMEQAAEEENSYISFIRLERVGGLDICTFAVRASEEEQYHLMFAGDWEEMEVSFEHLLIPATQVHGWNGTLFGSYGISQADINFDGKEDLLIYEGYSGGSGGNFDDYRAVVWEKDAKEFVWYPSFPEQLVVLEFNEQRVIDHYRIGVFNEVICEYGVSNGEYVMTRELIWEDHIDTKTLSYYEMGALVEQHDVTGMDPDEVISLYPDLGYWLWG